MAWGPPFTTQRIVSLNLWGGQAFEPLLEFVRAEMPGTDVFCFQEALNAPELVSLDCGFRTTLYRDLAAELPGFVGRFDPIVAWDQPTADGRLVRVPFGLATFARNSLPILDRRAEKIIEHQDTLDAAPGLHTVVRQLQLTEIDTAHGSLLVGNYHGIARPGSKLDSDERLEQSRAIRRALDRHDGAVLLIGDFNLLPETESVRLLESGLRNLVIEREIPTTRSRLNPYYGTPQEQPHADYAFISPQVVIEDFQVPDVEVSDHLPLILGLCW